VELLVTPKSHDATWLVIEQNRAIVQFKPCDFQIMKQDELVSMMNKIDLETCSVIGYQIAVCRILLHHYKWNKETLLER
jgi:hypothetical protein